MKQMRFKLKYHEGYMKIIILLLLCTCFYGCAVQQTYEPEKPLVEEFTFIQTSGSTEFKDGEITSMIETVAGKEVGDSFYGWPRVIKVEAGEVSIGLRLREITVGKTIASTLLVFGGLLGGVLAGDVASSDDSKELTVFKGQVENGKSYIIKIMSDTNSIKDLHFMLVEHKLDYEYVPESEPISVFDF